MTTTPAARTPVRDVPRRGHTLVGTGTLVRFALRRDRVRIPVWIAAILLFLVGSAAALPDFYTSAADRQARAELMTNPGTAAVSGPGFGLEDYTFGAMIANELLSWTAIFFALMSLLLMVRHTRAEEETGRAELVRAGVVGRHAGTTAALIVVGATSLVAGALVAVGLASLGIEDVGWASSWLFGVALATVGLVFAAVTAVTVQVTEHGRGAGGLAGAAFGAVYLLRAAGDMSAITGNGVAWLSWLSPVGWAQQTRAYVDDRWTPLLLAVALTAVLVAVAFWLSTRRDVGAALLPPRPGSATAGRWLSSPFGLAWRLHRTSVVWWGLALFLLGVGYGSLVGEVETFVADLDAAEDWIGAAGGDTLIDGFLAVIVALWATTAAIFAVLATLRLRSEETAGRAEPLLATAVAQTRWIASHLVVAVAGGALLLLLIGLGLGLTAAATSGEWSHLPALVGAALAYAPAVWLTIGVAIAVFGVVPRATVLVWVLIAYSAVIVNFVSLLGLPDWTTNLSPFGHVPMLPAEAMDWTPLVALTAIAAGLMAIGLVGFRRRDLTTTA